MSFFDGLAPPILRRARPGRLPDVGTKVPCFYFWGNASFPLFHCHDFVATGRKLKCPDLLLVAAQAFHVSTVMTFFLARGVPGVYYLPLQFVHISIAMLALSPTFAAVLGRLRALDVCGKYEKSVPCFSSGSASFPLLVVSRTTCSRCLLPPPTICPHLAEPWRSACSPLRCPSAQRCPCRAPWLGRWRRRWPLRT